MQKDGLDWHFADECRPTKWGVYRVLIRVPGMQDQITDCWYSYNSWGDPFVLMWATPLRQEEATCACRE
jgi:hypothetical protein